MVWIYHRCLSSSAPMKAVKRGVKRFVFVSIKWNIFHTKILHIESFCRRSSPKQRYKWGWEKVFYRTNIWATSKQCSSFFSKNYRVLQESYLSLSLFPNFFSFFQRAKLLFNRVRYLEEAFQNLLMKPYENISINKLFILLSLTLQQSPFD